MKVKEKGHTVIITQASEAVTDFLDKLTAEYAQFKDKNLIIDLSGENTSDVQLFDSLSEKHRSNKKSFVLVMNHADIDDLEDDIIIVPTLQEAHDVIEMEEIERDLGF